MTLRQLLTQFKNLEEHCDIPILDCEIYVYNSFHENYDLVKIVYVEDGDITIEV